MSALTGERLAELEAELRATEVDGPRAAITLLKVEVSELVAAAREWLELRDGIWRERIVEIKDNDALRERVRVLEAALARVANSAKIKPDSYAFIVSDESMAAARAALAGAQGEGR